ncbi:hypothetical protein L195_g061821, partial [Trifolium pratense]
MSFGKDREKEELKRRRARARAKLERFKEEARDFVGSK